MERIANRNRDRNRWNARGQNVPDSATAQTCCCPHAHGFFLQPEVVRKGRRFPIRIRRASRRGRGGVFEPAMGVGWVNTLIQRTSDLFSIGSLTAWAHVQQFEEPSQHGEAENLKAAQDQSGSADNSVPAQMDLACAREFDEAGEVDEDAEEK